MKSYAYEHMTANGPLESTGRRSLRPYHRGVGISLIVGYMLTIPVANLLIGQVGTECIPNGPCLIPVAPGILAPSGVLMIGAALLLRDLVQRRYGAGWSLGCIAAGTSLSFLVAPPALALASGLAFLVSELADFAVFTPLYRRGLIMAVLLSCAAGAVVDSALFLWLAFGSLDHIAGQIIGKAYASIAFAGWRRWIHAFPAKNAR